MRVVRDGKIEYDTTNSFYLLVHIMKKLNFSEVFEPGFPGLLKMIGVTESALENIYPELYNHMLE